MKVTVILGTRPEAIKLAPVILKLAVAPGFTCRVCVTAQHREMLDQVLQLFGIKPDADLDLMQPNQSLAELTARAVSGIDRYLEKERPDMVLVQGDTTTAFCAALAAFYRRIPFGHVEAGLRTGDLSAPWPEEANRVLTSRLTALHFAPTEWARQNLLREGVGDSTIHVTGNTVIDALLIILDKVRAQNPVVDGLPAFIQPGTGKQEGSKRMVLITGHRRENFARPFENICAAIAELSHRFPDVHFVYPVHLNPNVREPVTRILGNGQTTDGKQTAGSTPKSSNGNGLKSSRRNIHLIEPLSYEPFVALMERATLILTDSGGVQEEAPTVGKPVLVMREITERPEAVAAGTAKLVGTDRERIVQEVSRLLQDETAYNEMARKHNPYGDGHAAERIVSACQRFLATR